MLAHRAGTADRRWEPEDLVGRGESVGFNLYLLSPACNRVSNTLRLAEGRASLEASKGLPYDSRGNLLKPLSLQPHF